MPFGEAQLTSIV